MNIKRLTYTGLIFLCFLGGVFYFSGFMRGAGQEKTTVHEKKENTSSLSAGQMLTNVLLSDDVSWRDFVEQKKREHVSDPSVTSDIAFASSLLGDLSEAEDFLRKYCDARDISDCETVPFHFTISSPLDSQGRKLSGTRFEILGKPETRTDQKSYRTTLYKNIVFRTKVSKKGYTDFFTTERFTPWENESIPEQKKIIEPILVPSASETTINPGEDFLIQTDSYAFEGNAENFQNPDGSAVVGPIQIHFFDMGSDTPNFIRSQLLSLDIFSQDGTFIGSGMTTFGMPLVKAYAGDTELKIDPKNPVRVTGKIQDLYDFLIAEGKTPEEVAKTYARIPVGTKITLEKAHELELPPYWHLDTGKGIWTDSSYTILDQQGNLEFFIH